MTIWLAHGVFLIWFHRRRPKRLLRWIPAHAAVTLLVLPWMLFSLRGAVTWSQETRYTAQQLGGWFKAAHVAMALSVGETVHPLNVAVVVPAAAGFGTALLAGVAAARRRRIVPALLLSQAAVVFGVGMYFAAAAPKHLTILLPAWLGLAALGISQMRAGWRMLCAGLITVTMGASLFNYFSGREFTDADMVTPWRDIVGTVRRNLAPDDVVIVGYRPDAGARDMFDHYYRPGTPTRHLDFADWRSDLASVARGRGRIWLLLHDGDPWREIERWMRQAGWRFAVIPFQEEEHTLRGLREWLAARGEHRSLAAWLAAVGGYAGRHRSPLYRLYLITPRHEAQPSAPF